MLHTMVKLCFSLTYLDCHGSYVTVAVVKAANAFGVTSTREKHWQLGPTTALAACDHPVFPWPTPTRFGNGYYNQSSTEEARKMMHMLPTFAYGRRPTTARRNRDTSSSRVCQAWLRTLLELPKPGFAT